MLYSIVTIILAIYAVISPVIVLKSVKFGISCADKPEKAAEKPIFTLPKRKKEPEIPAAVQKGLDIIANIDAYDGTEAGQKEIK